MNPSSDISYLESLPLELLYSILLDLDFPDVARLCQTSSRLAAVCRDWRFWADKAWRDFEFPPNLFGQTGAIDPRARYLDVRRYYRDPRYFLPMAAQTGRLGLLEYLISQGAIDEPKRLDWPLAEAAGNGHLDLVKYLVDLGPGDLNWALENASYEGHINIVDYLISHGATRLDNALSQAASGGHLDIVTDLIDRGATDLNSALNSASRARQLDVIAYLIDQGANNLNESVLSAITANGCFPEIVEYLVGRGATNLNDALIMAQHYKCQHIVEFVKDRFRQSHK